MIEQRYNLHVRKLTKKDVFEGGYGRKLFDLVNATYKDLYGFSELTDRQIDQYVNMYFPLADLSLITVIEDGNADNRLAGMGITIPSLSRALQKCHRGRSVAVRRHRVRWHWLMRPFQTSPSRAVS